MLNTHKAFVHYEAFRDITRNIIVDHDNPYQEIYNNLYGRKIFFVGNGGSSSIASHMAIDYSKNGKYKAMAFNDAAALTCLGNDYSFEDVFAAQIEKWAVASDVLFAISSSGESQNIINAVKTARDKRCFIVTLSAFAQDNNLRAMGDINFYVNTMEYGYAEITHLLILHTILDLSIKERKPV